MQFIILVIVLIGCAIASVWYGKLTITAALLGAIIGILLYEGAGWVGIIFMAVFFVLGTLATSWQHQKKVQLGIAEKDRGRRNAGQVLANAGVAALLGGLGYYYPQKSHLFSLMMAAAFSSATADTLSSELGSIYGKNFYNILSFKKDTRGLDGVISLEGTICGVAGSILIAIVYTLNFGWSLNFLWIIIAGTIGNILDSLLGATLERRHIVHNDVVNFLNTLIAALTILLLV